MKVPILRLGYFVAGTPVPQGSKRAWLGKDNHVHMTEDAGKRHTSWRFELSGQARQQMVDTGYIEPFTQAIHISLNFKQHRPLSHYGSGRNDRVVKATASQFPVKVPDIDKLTRAVLDALTSIVWVDDSQVVKLTANKSYVERWEQEGVHIFVSTYEV